MATSHNSGTGKSSSSLTRLLHRWFLSAPAAMALAIFVSLGFGTWLSMLSKLSFFNFLSDYGNAVSAVTGAACGVAIALGLKSSPLTVIACTAVGAFSYAHGGPLCTYAVCVVSAEIGSLVSGKTKADLILIPLLTVIPGVVLTLLLGKPISTLTVELGTAVNQAAEMRPFASGLLISVLAGFFSVVPLSAGTITLSLGLEGAAGAAVCAGCSAYMATLAVGTAAENGVTGVLALGLGTPMLETPSMIRRPQLLIPCVLASAFTGPLSTAVLKMTCGTSGALGLCGLAGPVSTYDAMIAAGNTAGYTVFCILLVQVVLPALIGGGLTALFRRAGWLKAEDLKITRPEM